MTYIRVHMCDCIDIKSPFYKIDCTSCNDGPGDKYQPSGLGKLGELNEIILKYQFKSTEKLIRYWGQILGEETANKVVCPLREFAN